MPLIKFKHFRYIYFFIFFVATIYILIQIVAGRKAIIADDVENIVFSAESGFYDKEFDLTISSTGGKVYYTLDGSLPTIDSLEYIAPIHISDASQNENVYSMRIDVSAGFEEYGEILGADTNSGYMVPDFNVDKCTVVRAVVYYGENNYSEVKTASYFVGFNDKYGYKNMNVISIVTDPDNLFDYENGIYVTGKTFDDAIIKSEESSWWWLDANYTKRGPESEREANCQFFDADGKLLLSQKCGIRIHGGASRAFNPKSLNLYAREEYNGQDYFYYDFFGNDFNPHSVTLFSGGNDYYSGLQDYLTHNLVEDLNISTMDFVPYVVFLDGEYWGVYWLTEKYDKNYIQYHYGLDVDNVLMIKNDEVEEGSEEDLELFTNMTGFCIAEDMTDSNNYRTVCDLIDMDSYIDYNAVLIYISRHGDWPQTNYAVWRSKNKGINTYDDTKWRWMLFDVNSAGMLKEDVDYDSIANAMEYSPMFANLMNNDEFKTRLFDRLKELSPTTFSADKVSSEIDNFNNLMEAPMKKRLERFYGKGSGYLYEERVGSVRRFFESRQSSIYDLIDKY